MDFSSYACGGPVANHPTTTLFINWLSRIPPRRAGDVAWPSPLPRGGIARRRRRRSFHGCEYPQHGPGAIADPGTQGGPAFNLSKPEWIAIQNYVTDGLSLPITLYQFRNQLGSRVNQQDLSDFNQLITAYGAVHEHCNSWQTSIFPNTVALASDIFEYGNNKVPVYYPAIVEEANVLTTDPGNTAPDGGAGGDPRLFAADRERLCGKGKGQLGCDQAVLGSDAVGSETTWSAPRPSPGCSNITPAEYGQTSAEVAQFNEELVAFRLALSGDEAEYRHDCIVAETSASYAGSGRSGPSRRGSSRANSDTRPSRR